jgi:ATP-dependent DNA ligase
MSMTALEVFNLIGDIAATPSRIAKEGLVRKLAADPFGAFMIKWAYDPFITFGIRPALFKTTQSPNLALRPALIEKLLSRLATRDLTGNAAEREIYEVMAALDPDSAYLFYLILLKDFKCGIAEATINLAVPGLVPTFAVQRAQAYEAKFVKSWPGKAEYKLDGQRNTFLCKSGKGAFFTRSGKVVPALDFLVPGMIEIGYAAATKSAALHDVIMDGGKLSFMADGEAMMGLFSETGKLRSKDSKAEGAELHLYDFMSYADFDAIGAVGLPLKTRRELLSEFVAIAHEVQGVTSAIQILPQFFVNNDEEVQAFFSNALEKTLASYLARGDKEREKALLLTTIDKITGKPKKLEGAMVKDPEALYEKRKGRAWLKLKAEETEDLRIVGAYLGEPGKKYGETLGGLIVDRAGVYVCCGGGFSDNERDEIWALWLADLAVADETTVEETGIGRGPGHIITSKLTGFGVLNRLIEIEFHEVTPDGSLRHPRYKIFRDDKDGEREAA